MKRFKRIALWAVLILAACSLAPTVILYIKKPAPACTNEEATAKLAGNRGERFAFIVFGDNHAGLVFNDSVALKLIRRVNREDRFNKVPIDFVMVAGDVTNRVSEWDYRVYGKLRSLIKWPVISAVGNHDDDKDAGLFAKHIGRNEFSFANRNSYFVIVDNRVGDLTEGQFQQLEEELDRKSV